MSRVGQVFMGRTWFAVVTGGPALPRRKGSTVRGCDHKSTPDVLVHTLAVFGDWRGSGVHWPVERREESLASWELEGRRIA